MILPDIVQHRPSSTVVAGLVTLKLIFTTAFYALKYLCLCFKRLYGENKSGPSDRKETHCEVAVLLPLLLLLFVVGKAQRKLLNFYLLECFLKPLHLQ